MGKIDTDYLWLQDESPQGNRRLRWLALLLVVPLIGGAAWITASSQPDESNHAQATAPASNDPKDAAPVDAAVGAGPLRSAAASTAADARAQRVDDTALSADDQGATRLMVRSAATTDENATDLAGTPGQQTPAVDIPEAHNPEWREITIRPGDTLSIAFSRNDLSYADSLEIAHLEEYGDRFTRGLRAGDTMRVKADAHGRVQALDFPVDPLRTLQIRGDDGVFDAEMVLTDVERRKAYASGTIDTSFYVDALEAGLSDRQIMKLVKIFGWDIDFVLDTRPGDRFVVLYDELYKDGVKVADGNILAASFVNRGRDVRAVRFDDAGDAQGTVYYSPDGRAMKKAFIRTPVDYTRISSQFNLSRKHPILNRIRRHEGTDYAAPTGTPIKATGNGRIVFRGRRGGYGNMVIIKHDRQLTTRYGHMASFSKKFGVGSKVRQGDIIGYVGMSGLATGPHLHYEFRVDGDPKDPERVDLPKALPLPEDHLDDFEQQSAPLLAQLDALTDTNIAQADTARAPAED